MSLLEKHGFSNIRHYLRVASTTGRRTVHDVLYRPQEEPDEQTLEHILISLASALREIELVLSCVAGQAPQSGLFAKTKKQKDKVMAEIVEAVQSKFGEAVEAARAAPVRVAKHGKVARESVLALHETMGTLLPQIRHWLKTGHVAKGKIISLKIPELYSIVRGKVGKEVEFGLTWDIRRLRGGYLLATLATSKGALTDTSFAVTSTDRIAILDGIRSHGSPALPSRTDRSCRPHGGNDSLLVVRIRLTAAFRGGLVMDI